MSRLPGCSGPCDQGHKPCVCSRGIARLDDRQNHLYIIDTQQPQTWLAPSRLVRRTRWQRFIRRCAAILNRTPMEKK